MTQINFPVATQDGQTFNAPNGVVYTYVGTPPNGYWSGTFQNEGFTTLDGRYLKLDSSNDPVVGGLNITNGPVGIKTTSPVSVAHLDITGTAGKILVRTDQDDECIDCVNLANSAFSPLRIRGSDVAIQNGSTVNLFVKADGNVGIGSESPSEKLVLANVAAPTGFSDTAISMIRSNYGGRIAGYLDQGVGHGITIDTIDSATPTERLRITGDGDVGIGTDSPNARLSVSENGRSINLGVPVEGYATVEQRGSSNTALEVGGWGDVVIAADTNSVSSKNIIFSKQGTQGSYSETMRIASSGNVGIGNDNPESALSINTGGTLRLGSQEDFMISGQPIGAIYFGALSNPSAGIECDWQGNNNPTIAIGCLRDKSTGNNIKAQTRYQYDGSIRNLIQENEIMRIQSNGLVIPSGKGITFEYSTSSGAASSSGFLKDYETGQFTPSLTDVTAYKYRNGNYTKIGDTVYFWVRIQANSSTPSASAWQITGLPYTSANADVFGGAWRSYGKNVFSDVDPVNFHIAKSSTAIIAKVGNNGGANVATNNVAFVSLNDQIILNGFYKALGG